MTIIFGKSTFHKRETIYQSGICPHCKKESTLSNFSADEYYHIYFIPLILKGEYHYLNYCHKCNKSTKHDLEKWYAFSTKELEQAQLSYQYNKKQYRAAIEMHMAYRTYAPPLDSIKFAIEMEREFTGNAQIHKYLGQFYLDNFRLLDAKRNYIAYYNIVEDKEEGNLVLADILYRLKDYKGALKYYSQIKTYSDKDTVANLVNICAALRKDSLYSECDEILSMMQERYIGNLDKVAGYKREMYHSGGRVGLDNSRYQNYMAKRYILAGLVILALLSLLPAANYYLMQNQPLYITNGLTKKAEVTIPGKSSFTLYPNDTFERVISEGKHAIEVKLENKNPYKIEIDVKNSLLDRILNKNIFVVNIKGARLLEYGKILYTTNQRESEKFDNETTLIIGQEFTIFRNIDYRFKMPPDEIRLKEGHSKEIRSFVDTINPYDEIHALNILMNNLEYTREEDVLAYMRNIIAFDDPTTDFVDAYNDVVNYLKEN